ncbi:Iron(III)-hydroxamate-binding protein fhuD [Stutzerimonas stutzeri]|nr:Iron(III)-hydroxamate-binding protein fhuD [Stutzerimonas stutzeri]
MLHLIQKTLFALCALFVAFNAVPNQPQADHTYRYATVDWSVAETLLALGEPPLAVGDVQSYQTWVMEPKLPADTLDLGIRLQPNFERIASLQKLAENRPLVFIHSPFYAALNDKLALYGKVYNVEFYKAGDAWNNIVTATQEIGRIIQRPNAVLKLLSEYQQDIEHYRPLLQPFTDHPIALVQFIDTRHLRIYGTNSLLGAVLKQLGFQNAYLHDVNYWGFQNIEITQLAKFPSNTRFVVIKPYPHNIAAALTHNTLWQRLPLAKAPLILPAVWTFGALPSAQRFVHIFADGLLHGGESW